MQSAVGRSCHPRGIYSVVEGTTIATVTPGLVSASDTFLSVTRQSVPLEAKDKLRFAEDEGYVRLY
jgi:hypothetical protein